MDLNDESWLYNPLIADEAVRATSDLLRDPSRYSMITSATPVTEDWVTRNTYESYAEAIQAHERIRMARRNAEGPITRVAIDGDPRTDQYPEGVMTRFADAVARESIRQSGRTETTLAHAIENMGPPTTASHDFLDIMAMRGPPNTVNVGYTAVRGETADDWIIDEDINIDHISVGWNKPKKPKIRLEKVNEKDLEEVFD